ncbi:hypothetical protein I79_000820 [Cricetulus griseus]|uniref:Uncharacterized protein n=1 Tax=Cricetulus griseus TaxID=10029 RepID=G3GT46_CRIGR|nr:hypothetical protein I79_000820 [Cricetulus griseus]
MLPPGDKEAWWFLINSKWRQIIPDHPCGSPGSTEDLTREGGRGQQQWKQRSDCKRLGVASQLALRMKEGSPKQKGTSCKHPDLYSSETHFGHLTLEL